MDDLDLVLSDMSDLLNESNDNKKQNGEDGLIEISRISENPYQPRQDIDGESIQKLAKTISKTGLLNSITVRKYEGKEDFDFELIAGQRRILAFELNGKTSIPAKIVIADDLEAQTLTLTENLHQKNVSDIDWAYSYQGMMDRHGFSQKELAKELSENEKKINRCLSILTLPLIIRSELENGKILSTQTAIELRKAYEIDLDSTLAFIADNNDISYNAANLFYRSIRDKNKVEKQQNEDIEGEEQTPLVMIDSGNPNNEELTEDLITSDDSSKEVLTGSETVKDIKSEGDHKDNDNVSEVRVTEDKNLDYDNSTELHQTHVVKNILGDDAHEEFEAVAESLTLNIHLKLTSEIEEVLESLRGKTKDEIARTIIEKFYN